MPVEVNHNLLIDHYTFMAEIALDSKAVTDQPISKGFLQAHNTARCHSFMMIVRLS